MKNIKVIAFDMDNTLIDRQHAARNFLRDMVNMDTNGRLSDVEMDEFIEEFMELDLEGSQDKEILFSFYLKRLNISHRTWMDVDRQWAQELYNYLRLVPYAIEVLDQLSKNYRLALLTNGNAQSQRLKMSVFPHLNWFDVTMVAEEYGAQKPDRTLFDQMALLLGVENHEIVYVGDHPVNDVFGAVNAGMKAVLVREKLNEPIEVPYVRVRKLVELLDLFD